MIKLRAAGHAKLVKHLHADLTKLKRTEQLLQESEHRFRSVMDAAPYGVVIVDQAGEIVLVNSQTERLFGYGPEELLGQSVEILIPQRFRDQHYGHKDAYFAHPGTRPMGTGLELYGLRKDGTEFPAEIGLSPFETQAGLLVTSAIFDLSERKRAEYERQVIFEIIQGLSSTANLDELLKLIHQSISKMLYAENCSVALYDKQSDLLHMEFFVDQYDPAPAPQKVGRGPTGYVFRTGRPILMTNEVFERLIEQGAIESIGTPPAAWLGAPLRTPAEVIGVLVVQHYEDPNAYGQRELEFLASVGDQIALVIERKRTEEALQSSQTQLEQSQKLEAIGQLAGGLAHDFNNLLTAIIGYSELSLRRLDSEDPISRNIEEIQNAARRAASLTRQLLAFSRKQILEPKVLELNAVVSDMYKLLRRLIGEDLDLITVLPSDLGRVKADPGQIEQVLMNLVVNARDAMPGGGRLTIETANACLDNDYARQHLPTQPGEYVMLAITDTGTGMDKETQARIFEPFFTTKETGKGTGLGLSTVYGIVKQSGGYVWVYSEVGTGTTFKIYLPRVDEAADGDVALCGSVPAPHGTETILLVEDEEQVRQIVREILEAAGYDVLVADKGEEAIRLCIEHPQEIHLLLSDVVMPGASGKEIAERLVSLRPEMKVLFMSGYTDEAIVHHGVLDSGVKFIQKPFSPAALSRRVREVLDVDR